MNKLILKNSHLLLKLAKKYKQNNIKIYLHQESILITHNKEEYIIKIINKNNIPNWYIESLNIIYPINNKNSLENIIIKII